MRFTELLEVAPGSFSRESLDKHRSDAISRGLPVEDQEEAIAHEAVIVCRQCRYYVTDASKRISVDGTHHHTFANPHGHVFDIGCFRSADGCRGIGPSSKEFTWFTGYEWRIVVCANCKVHLGWYFRAVGGSHFFGLIFDRLINPS